VSARTAAASRPGRGAALGDGRTSHKSLRAAGRTTSFSRHEQSRPARTTPSDAVPRQPRIRRRLRNFNDQESIEVARRIEREKGSTYRLNGARSPRATCSCCSQTPRPGARSPALVHQGRIGEIIQASPSSAAACWKSRRRCGSACATSRCGAAAQGAETNLARLEDVIGQLAQQMDALKRQAAGRP